MCVSVAHVWHHAQQGHNACYEEWAVSQCFGTYPWNEINIVIDIQTAYCDPLTVS